MSTMFHIYGDESIIGDNVVYGLVIVPVEILEIAEETLAKVKVSFKASRSARFHCREVFHKDARRKSEWSHLTDKEAFDLALKITGSLAGKGLGTIVGHVNRKDCVYDFPGVGERPSMAIQDVKQLIPYAYFAAVSQLTFDVKYADLCKLWIEPNSDLIRWHGSGRQVERLLKINKVDINSGTITPKLMPENLESKDRPMLLELADLLAYCSCRVLANSGKFKNRYSDRVIEAIYKSMSPVVHTFKQIDPAKTKEGMLTNFVFK